MHRAILKNSFLLLAFVAGSFGISVSQTFSKVSENLGFIPDAPVIPVPGSRQYCTDLMFEYPMGPGVAYCKIELYQVTGGDTVLFRTVTDSTCATRISGLAFGNEYVWRYLTFPKKKKKPGFISPWYSFHTAPLPQKLRVSVANSIDGTFLPGYLSFDYAQMIVDRSGAPVWILPPSPEGLFGIADQVRDLQVSPAGTITFLTEKNAFELAPDGRLLWKGTLVPPSAMDKIEQFHHGFRRLPNGNFLVMGYHTTRIPWKAGDTATVRVQFGVVAEMTHHHKLVWKWDSQEYFSPKDLFFRKLPDGTPDVSMHLNACTMDDSMRYVYAGFRDMNRIVKIDRKSGEVVASWGSRFPSGEARFGNGFFSRQHDVVLLPGGDLMVFNNDSVDQPDVTSSVIRFTQPANGDTLSRITWSFPCRFDDKTDGKSERGGSVQLLPNGNYLVNMGSLPRCIEVTTEKQVVWDALAESFDPVTGTWSPLRNYRSHWSPGLYPCYFTSWISDTTAVGYTLQIANEGTSEDTYTVEYHVSGITWKPLGQPYAILPGSRHHILVPKTAPDGTLIRIIRIRSGRNGSFFRTVKL